MSAPALPDAILERTLPSRLAGFARTRPADVALRVKERGLWREITWAGYYAQAQAAGAALVAEGVEPGGAVAILSDNRPEWLFADLGAQGIGARSVGIYQTNPPGDVAYVLNHSGASVLLCEDQEQVDKAVAVAGQTPGVRRVVVFDPRGLRGYDDPRIMAWDAFLERGRAALAADPDLFTRRLGALDPAAPASVVYTSGTTGQPKGALLSHLNLMAPGAELARELGITSADTLLSYLPLCHVAEKLFTFILPLSVGATVHFGESIATVQEDLREVSPTVFLGVPRIWEKMHAGVTLKMRNASWLKRALYRTFSALGEAIAARRRDGAPRPWDPLVWLVGSILVFWPLKERLGLRRCRLPISGAAPIAPELLSALHGLGIPIYEGYGQTECTGVSHVNRPGDVRLGTVGPPIPGIEQRLGEDGEVLVRGPHVFVGYLHDEAATRATVDADGWLHTGDLGALDATGRLTITGRKKEILITSGGKNLSPEKIEGALRLSPFIKEAVAIGDSRRFVAALIQIDADATGDWATRAGIPFTSYEDLSRRPEIAGLIEEAVRRANEELAQVEQVRAFRLLPRELHQDEGELTATQKVRRKAVMAGWASLIEEMYR